jgi:hypothetical protein
MPTHTPAERGRTTRRRGGFERPRGPDQSERPSGSDQFERPSGFDPLADVGAAQDFTREGVIASGELLRPELMSRIGDTLGGLNAIGALRSGGTRVALGEVNREFTDRIGNIASRATLGALGTGVQAGGLRLRDRDLQFREEEAKRARKFALLKAIGGVVGAGIGFALGPLGAVAGAGGGGGGGGGGGIDPSDYPSGIQIGKIDPFRSGAGGGR